jgi:hypothetical protein
VNAAVNDDAANTVTSPDTPGGADVSGTVVAAASLLELALSSSSPQADTSANSATAVSNVRRALRMSSTLVSQ